MNIPYFNSQYLTTQYRYVAWLDVMGSRTMMTRSLETTANFIFKLHVASLESPHDDIQLYPMNDGVFAVGDRLIGIRDWLSGSFQRIGLANKEAQPDQTKVFFARAAVAYGSVAEGRHLGIGASDTLRDNPIVRDAILIGAPVVNAYLSERHVGPFGIFVHESARTFAPAGNRPWTSGAYMRYWKQDQKPAWVTELESCVRTHLNYCRAYTNEFEYTEDSICQHEILMREFFSY